MVQIIQNVSRVERVGDRVADICPKCTSAPFLVHLVQKCSTFVLFFYVFSHKGVYTKCCTSAPICTGPLNHPTMSLQGPPLRRRTISSLRPLPLNPSPQMGQCTRDSVTAGVV